MAFERIMFHGIIRKPLSESKRERVYRLIQQSPIMARYRVST